MAFRQVALLFLLLGRAEAQTCGRCHSDIAKKYAQTAMAHASGPVADLQLPDGEVKATAAQATYSIRWQNGKAELRYRKTLPDGTLIEGGKNLSRFIGSGTHGRGFIFEEQGQLFQAPVAYFGAARGWDLAPGYEAETSIYLGRKIETACLTCHTSGADGAITCQRCHGQGADHHVLNPAKLAAEERDSVCAQCHVTGETRVVKAGRSETSFQPGMPLADHIVPFVRTAPDQNQFKVVGHFEGLWQSKCKRASGDKMSCLTCHDPHSEVPTAEKAGYYRAKCLTCHERSSCKAPITQRTQNADSCIACHMPSRATTDGQHTAFTDHSIRRVANVSPQPNPSNDVTAFWPARANQRDKALAEADLAWQSGDAAHFKKAHDALASALPEAQADAALLSQLAYTDDLLGDADQAQALYQRALAADKDNLLALTNLGTHLARAGKFVEAQDLWKRAVAINPGLQAPALNLARVQWRLGQRDAARTTVKQVLSLNPDSEQALPLFHAMQSQK